MSSTTPGSRAIRCSGRAAMPASSASTAIPTKALAFSSDVTPRYCEADPYRGRQAGGRRMLAQPHRRRRRADRRDRQPQFRQSRAARDHGPAGRGRARHRRGLPRARFPDRFGQRLALQRDQRPGHPADPDHRRRRPASPTGRKMARIGFAAEGEPILLVGAPDWWGTHLGQSIYLRDLFGRKDGPPPPVDLAHEKQGRRSRPHPDPRRPRHRGARPLSDGGLAVALAEMAMASGIGATVNQLEGGDPIPQFFGEDQGRYLVTVRAISSTASTTRSTPMPASSRPWIGTTGGTLLKLGDARGIPVSDCARRTKAGSRPTWREIAARLGCRRSQHWMSSRRRPGSSIPAAHAYGPGLRRGDTSERASAIAASLNPSPRVPYLGAPAAELSCP